MATGGGDGLYRGGYEGCISGSDMGIQRRPYHKNCSCALHKSRGHCSHTSASNLSYPIRRSWSDGCLALNLMASSAHPSSCSSPVTVTAEAARRELKVPLINEEKETRDP
ncbi:uncharacterized protein LOC132278443 [Cornus florida]|uniref:uncharacterized protein LOC132278443 n=1 Tax=Cornus florida TaxID=4283 RepID=UPI00289C1A64|nr:uncharacterized protein LOC132278443 [Cornus florida]